MVNGDNYDYYRYYYDIPKRRGNNAYYVQLDIKQLNSTNKICAGALITNEWVLTSCECLSHANNITVYLGDASDDGYMFNIGEENLFQMNSTHRECSFGDVGLIKLPYSIKYTETVQRIELPTHCKNMENKNVSIISHNFEQAKGVLDTRSKTVSLSKCEKKCRHSKAYTSTYCVFDDIEDLSNGDNNGKIVVQPDGELLLGIVNHHISNEYRNSSFCFIFRHILVHSAFISKYTGLDLVSC